MYIYNKKGDCMGIFGFGNKVNVHSYSALAEMYATTYKKSK